MALGQPRPITSRPMTLTSAPARPTGFEHPTTHTMAHPPSDIMVFERTDSGFSLIGGNGRGAGWAGIVDVPDAEQTLVRKAWSVGTLVRLTSRRPQQVVGPY